MKKLFFALMLLPLSAYGQRSDGELQKQIDIFVNLYRTLDMFYVDTLAADTAVRWAIDGMLGKVDPFTVYYPNDDDEELMQITRGKYAGIGALIRWNRKHKRAQIAEPYEDTPSHKAGLRAGDILLSIDGRDIYNKMTAEVTKMLRGEAGTTFSVSVLRGKDTLDVSLTRRSIQLPVIPYSGLLPDSVGYISLTGFVEGTAVAMRRTVMSLMDMGMKSLVLDLRSNPGGSLEEASDILSLFLPKGSLVVSRKGKMPSACGDMFTRTQPIVPATLPVAVLVNSASASAAEIVSGTLQDMDRAVVVGQRTYGKGLVQSIRDMPEGGSLKITTSRYYIPSGRCIQAYDYRHLNPDGSVGTVPDSLTRVFRTAAGREVRDGGGIKPDVVVTPDSLPTLVFDIVESDVMFDFATDYAASHPIIARPGEFEISDEDYQAFVDYVVANDFKYNRRSDEVLKTLRQIARIEGYLESAQDEFDALERKLNPEPSVDLMRNRREIARYLADEIVTRYYYRSGSVRQMLVGDKDYDTAVGLLRDGSYKTILGK